ncbi:gamma-glutamyltranspeptidase / glutathione hydrolase [Streptomyces sp. SolWspMP-sol7th]|nr:gamma-glutamyltranspeptidase / glutathione hydrolase [Streptomyces sp. SolWspMP-sol7th]
MSHSAARRVGRRRTLSYLSLTAVVAGALSLGAAPPQHGSPKPPVKTPVATGWGGAVASVDADASAAGIEVLRKGGNAVDAAVATAAALGVTEPYSSGLGGGGYFVYYDARTHRVHTLDGRETAPRTADKNLFVEDGKPLAFADAVTSGLSVGTPGTPATWDEALRSWGRKSTRDVLAPATRLARQGFTVDGTFRQQTADNAARFRDFPASAKLFLPGGEPPAVGTTLKNPDLARTYDELSRKGLRSLYGGALAQDIVRTATHPRSPRARPASRVRASSRSPTCAPTTSSTRLRPAPATGASTCTRSRPPPPAARPSARR